MMQVVKTSASFSNIFSIIFCGTVLCLIESCLPSIDANSSYKAPTFWSEPIADYLISGEENYPDGFNRSIVALYVFDGRLWIGYGDSGVNMGTVTPIEFRKFDDPNNPEHSAALVDGVGQGAPQRTPTDTGEEKIVPYRNLDGRLWQAGSDSNDPDEHWTQAIPAPEKLIQGNLFVLEGSTNEPVWRKLRSIPGGEHVHDVAQFDGSLYAVGSGADNRAEWESGRIYRYLWRSEDGGRTFSTFHRAMYPDLSMGDTRYRALLSVGNTLYVFGYVNPFVEKGPMEGRHVALRGEKLTEVGGEIGKLVVWQTWSLSKNLGLAIGNIGKGVSRSFRIVKNGIRELESWSRLRIVMVSPGEKAGLWLVLSGDGMKNESFAVHRFRENSMEELEFVLDLGFEAASSIAYWMGDLFIGTPGGNVLRSKKEKE